MRTTLLKKMSAVVMATLMVVAMFAGMAFSTSAAASDIELTVTVGGNKTATMAAIYDDATTTVTIALDDTAKYEHWALKGESVQIETASGEAIYLKAGTTKVGMYLGKEVVYDATAVMPATADVTAGMALEADYVTDTTNYTKFYGFDFVLTDGTVTKKYSKGEATFDGTALTFTKFDATANVTLTVSGPNITDGVSTARKSMLKNGFTATIAYKEGTETLRVKATETPETVVNYDTDVKLTVTAADVVFGGKANWLSANGMVLMDLFTTEEGVVVIAVDMKNNLIDETPISFEITDAAIATKDNKAKFTVTDYNETFTVALDDGTTGLIAFTAKTNYDTEDVITNDDIVDLVKSSAFRSLKGLTSVKDGVIYVDMINAVVGQSNKYINWTLIKDSKTEYENKGFSLNLDTTKADDKYTQADVNKKIALFGYFTEADGSITSKVQNYWGSMTFYEPNDIPGFNDKFTGVKDLYTGSATVLVYNDGTEDVQAILYHNDAATVLPIVMNDITYNVPVFHIIRSDYTKAFAVGTAATQQVATTVTNAGSYSYSLTGSEMGLSKLVKEETPIAITLTSRVDMTQAANKDLAPAGADIILVLRAPKNTEFELVDSNDKSTTYITGLTAPAATALTTTDGLVDYFFVLNYKTFSSTTEGLRICYDNGTYKDLMITTNWLTDKTADAYKAFTNTIPATTTEFVIALPERPVESQETPSIETPVSSSTATPVESTPASSSTGSDLEVPGTGNPFSAVAYLITLCASAIGGISTLVIRKKK